MAKSIHMMIRVLDEDRSVNFYHGCFGLEVADRFEFDGFTLVYMRNEESSFEIELTINHDQEASYTHGSGYGHVAFSVSDIEAEHGRLSSAGFSPLPIKEFHRDGSLMAKFFFIEDPDGYKIEVLQRHGRYI